MHAGAAAALVPKALLVATGVVIASELGPPAWTVAELKAFEVATGVVSALELFAPEP